MSSENFMKGDSIIGLQIFFSSGAIARIDSLSVGIVPPDFGSSREEIVPPVMTIATFGNCRGFGVLVFWCLLSRGMRDWIIFADRISDSLIPML